MSGVPIVHVLSHAATPQLAPDPFARDSLRAVDAREQSAGVRQVAFGDAAVLALKHILAGVERHAVDQPPVLPFEHRPIAPQLADVETIIEDVRQRGTLEPRLTRRVCVSFRGQAVAAPTSRRESPRFRRRGGRAACPPPSAVRSATRTAGKHQRGP